MLHVSFQTSFTAVAQIFAVGAVGFFLVKRRLLNQESLKLLSVLSINVSFPFFIFNRIISNFDPVLQPHWWQFPFINVGLVMTGILVAGSIAFFSRRKQPREWTAASVFHNAGYIPLLFITMLPGDQPKVLYPYVLLTILGFDTCLWSIGVWLVAYHRKATITWRNFINPPLIAMFTALIFVLLGWKGFFPDLVLKPVRIIGDSALALAILTIGGNLALTSFKEFQWKDVMGAVSLKLLLLPVLALILLRFVPVESTFGFILILQACMPTSITLSVIARYSDSPNQDFLNQVIFLTHLLCILTIPIFLSLYDHLIH